MGVRLDVVAELALALPEVTEDERRGARVWLVGGKFFAWERRFSKADLRRFGDEPVPADPILGVKVDDLADKEAVLSEDRPGYFTIPHFDGFAAVLVELGKARKPHVRESLEDAWLATAPKKVVAAYLDGG